MRGPGRYYSLDDHGRDPGTEPEIERPELRREELKLVESRSVIEPEPDRAPDTPPAEEEPRDYEAEWEAKRAAKAQELDALLESGKIDQSERTRREALFDNQHLVEMNQRQLQEDREILREARATEQRQAQERDLGRGWELSR